LKEGGTIHHTMTIQPKTERPPSPDTSSKKRFRYDYPNGGDFEGGKAQ